MSTISIRYMGTVWHSMKIYYVVNGDWSMIVDSYGTIQKICDGRLETANMFNKAGVECAYIGKKIHDDEVIKILE